MRVLLPAVAIIVLALVSLPVSASGTVTITDAYVEGFVIHVLWEATQHAGVFLIYFDGHLVGEVDAAWQIPGYHFEYPAVAHFTYVEVYHYIGGNLVGYDFAYIDWSGIGGFLPPVFLPPIGSPIPPIISSL